MNDSPQPEQILNFEGPEGETLFRRMVAYCLPVEWQASIQGEVDEVFAHLTSEDDRAVALVAALVIDDGVSQLLAAHAPGFKELAYKREFGFSSKIELARALRLCPSRLLGAADTVRKIRNDFAHRLSLSVFDDCKPEHLRSARDHLKSIQPALVDGKSNQEVFTSLASMLYLALRGYRFHVDRLNRFVRDDLSFQDAFRKHCESKYP